MPFVHLTYLPGKPALRYATLALAFALAVAIGTWIGLDLVRSSEVAVIWPPNGIILAALLSVRGRRRAAKQAGIAMLGLGLVFAMTVLHGHAQAVAAQYMVAHLIELTVALALLQDRLGSRSSLARPAHLFFFTVLGMGVAPLASACYLLVLFGFDRMELLPIWWAGHAIGLAAVTPLALTFAARHGGFRPFKRRPLEAILLLGLVAAAVGATFLSNDLPLLFMSFAPLILVVMRFGGPGAAWVLPLAALGTAMGSAAGHGPLVLVDAASPLTRLVVLEAYLATLVVTLLPLGAVITQLRRRERTLGRRAGRVRKVEARMRESEQLYRLLADNSSDIISRFNLDANRLYITPSVVDILGWSTEEMLQPNYKRYIHPDDLAGFIAVGEQMRAGTERASNVYRYMRRDGSWAWLEARLIMVRDAAGNPHEIISNARDITRQKEAEIALASAAAELTELAATDALTGVANRRRFDEMLDREWRRAMRSHDQLSLLMIDVDQFKPFNDHYGHLMGDTCLHAIATAIAGSVRRPGDLVARYGGEEFAVILPNTDGNGAMEIANRVRDGIAALSMPHFENLGGHVTVSIGVAEAAPNRSTESSVLVDAADAALYAAKHLGRDRTERAPRVAMVENVVWLPVAKHPTTPSVVEIAEINA